jgi:hypothetical protein
MSVSAPNLPAAPNVYDRIDQGASPIMLHSGVQQVAVGLRDPNLGWVEVKTQNLAGRVDATLVAASGQAHAALAAQLPAISDYLQQRDVRVATLAVQHHMPGTGSGVTPGDSGGRGAESGGSQSRQPGQSASGNSGSGSPDAPLQPLRPPGSLRYDEGPSFRPLSYISVRA